MMLNAPLDVEEKTCVFRRFTSIVHSVYTSTFIVLSAFINAVLVIECNRKNIPINAIIVQQKNIPQKTELCNEKLQKH